MIDLTINYLLKCYYQYKPLDVFDFRDKAITKANLNELYYTVILSDYEDAEKVFNYCRDIAGRNYSAKQKRTKFLNVLMAN